MSKRNFSIMRRNDSSVYYIKFSISSTNINKSKSGEITVRSNNSLGLPLQFNSTEEAEKWLTDNHKYINDKGIYEVPDKLIKTLTFES